MWSPANEGGSRQKKEQNTVSATIHKSRGLAKDRPTNGSSAPAKSVGKAPAEQNTGASTEGKPRLHGSTAAAKVTPAQCAQQNFRVETLSSNRTSQKANTINFSAQTHTMPRSHATPVQHIAGQRQASTPASLNKHHRLSKEAAARLAALRDPYAGRSRSQSPHQQASTSFTEPVASSSSVMGPKQRPGDGCRAPVSPSDHLWFLGSTGLLHGKDRRSLQPNDPVQLLREYNLSAMSQGIGQTIPTKRVDYRTQATPVPATQNEFVRVGPGFLRDNYSDDNDDVDMDDYIPQARAYAKAQAYQYDEVPEVEHDVSSPDIDTQTVYDNDFDDEQPEHEVADNDLHNERPASPQSVVSYGPGEPQSEEDTQTGGMSPHDTPYRKARRTAGPREGRHRARKGDYEPQVQEILHEAAKIFKSFICLCDAYPNKLHERAWVAEAWQKAATNLDIQLASNSKLLSIIMQYSWNLRGEAYNRQRVSLLSRAHAFAYEIIGERPESHVGLYEAEIIQLVINRIFYKTATDDAVRLATTYEPFPSVGLTLVLTAIQCVIDEWESGVFLKVTFSEENYYGVYKRHLQELCAFEDESGLDHILMEICTKISVCGREHARAPARNQHNPEVLSRSAISDAVASYKRQKDAARWAGSEAPSSSG
ncbi:hypothetical protein BN946_scf184877.g1 [Trametes cinnabarina]|uniref:DUF6532 domain-containing protein n=1 Tax=Pycnoporus cinnabarinus TaxID=5643 RepID=A0A060SN14_PYCCI|nr:hypothetical protein BN946_scf184877.g1 [Trametes cinnabarina]